MRSFFIYVILVLSSLSLKAQEPDSSSALFGLREAERNFARASVMLGRNAAFIENLAENSIVFTDRWITNGKEFSKNRQAAPIVLKWEPEFIDISGSRDFGISTGPWEVQEYRPYTAPVSTGYYLSVWEKQEDTWKVILDDGTSTPSIKNYNHKFSFPEGADKKSYYSEKKDQRYADELAGREKQMLEMWNENHIAPIYESFMASGAVMIRNKHYPESNRDSIKLWISQRGNTFSWITAGAKTASSGDLGFTYGLIVRSEMEKESVGHYVRIWKKQGETWKITIELINVN